MMVRPAPGVVGFVGFKGAGKTTAAEAIMRAAPNGVIRVQVAGPLKAAVSALLGRSMPHAVWYADRLNRQDVKALPWREGSEATVRDVLETVGMALRDMDPGGQAALMATEAQRLMRLGFLVVVDDVNFTDEAQAILDLGGTLFYVPGPSGRGDIKHLSDYGVRETITQHARHLRTWDDGIARQVELGDFSPLYREE
ncbi:hypothetical protein UFOVP411_39 [uncultured Caudovirales phage]|uniref:Uncharacterized protein n=1 Tax=uncultured Caudovirales phage TaxID=2100421 RepID=A0A6J5M6F7_9CAUD|nr:hypothetical protein UFOVP411_39 [uncultured Caudovirales phage]